MYADEQKAKYDAGLAGCAQAQTPMSNATTGRPSLREQLEKQFYSQQEGHAKLVRAIDILVRHPEFEELIELQDIIKNRI